MRPEHTQRLQEDRLSSDRALKRGSGPHRASHGTELWESPCRKPQGPTKVITNLQKIERDRYLF